MKKYLEYVAFPLHLIIVAGLIFEVFGKFKNWDEEGSLAILLLGILLILLLLSTLAIFIFYNNKEKKLKADLELKDQEHATLLENNKLQFEKDRVILKDELSSLKKELTKQKNLAKYANVFGMLNSAFEHLHYCTRNGNIEFADFKHGFSVFCENLARAYQTVTGVDCHVCIKLATSATNSSFSEDQDLKDVIIRTFCRSSTTAERRIVDSGKYQHMLIENTSYEYIFTNYGKSFFCNNLPIYEGYKNSSLKYYMAGNNYTFKSEPNTWPLPYKSTIVSPIVPSIAASPNERIIVGLLCVDCDVIHGFKEPDKIILQGCADGLYNSFKKCASIIENNNLNHGN